MATNNFKPFATGTGANVLSQAEYEALAALVTGFTSGKASSAQVNKALRQSTFIAASIAQFILNKLAIDVLDDGDLAGFVTDFGNALNKHSQPLDAGLTSLAALAGGANMLPYYTAADVFAQTSLTAIGRSLIGQTTQANALSYLGGAPLDSPTFTGTPAAPTAAAGTNTTQIATMAALLQGMAEFGLGNLAVTITDLNAAPSATTQFYKFTSTAANIPLAGAGGNMLRIQYGATTYTDIVITLAGSNASLYNRVFTRMCNNGTVGTWTEQARLDSPAFTGTPTAPTAKTGDNSTQIATTAFVQTANTGIVGAAVNAKMTIATASATGTFTADEIIVADSLAGRQFRLTAFSKTVNLAATGANGMDTGTAPTSGFVALYAIYNPTTATSALLAVNATAAAVAEIYGGANMPSGYTASALLCVVPTDSTGKIVPLLQMGRKTLIATAQLSSTTAFISTPTALNISATVPKNAKFLDGILYLVSGNSTRPVISVQPLATPAVGMKQVVGGNSTGVNNTQAPFSDLAISTAQTIYWQVSAGVAGDTISSAFTYATGYSI